MYLIKDKSDRYLKINIDNKVKFVSNETLADVFPSEREANDFIRKFFRKKTRKNYKVVRCDNDFVSDLKTHQSSTTQEIDDGYTKGIQAFDEIINTYLNPEIEKYTEQLREYDYMILDIRHWLRDKKTKLNACQGYQAMKKLQDIERERVDCKKELQRVAMLRGSIRKACNESVNFEHEEYKYKQIKNMEEFLFGS